MNIYTNTDNKQDIRSKAADTRNTLSVLENGNISDIQSSVNAAKDGDTIVIPPGTYSGPLATPLGLGGDITVSAGRGASETCFLRIENKKITIKGAGAMLFGEGHDQPYKDPYQNRAGVCVINSSVTFDGLRVKEFQKRCMVVYNSSIVYKNGTIDGCDEGGASLLGNSSGLFVNNLFAEFNFGGILLWQNSRAKIVNNTFWRASVTFFYHPGTNDQAHADVINNIFEHYSSVIQVDWWPAEAAKLKTNNLSYNLIHKLPDEGACGTNEFCDNFPGKITGDPKFVEPVTDPRGIAAWANFSLGDGSPATGIGDSQIPGTKNLGHTGGPCIDGNSSTCLDFISKEKNNLQPSPTMVAPTINYPTQQPTSSFLQPTSSAQPTSGILISEEPPITYYIPPTIPNNNPSRLESPPPSGENKQTVETTPVNSPTPQPTRALIVDMKKTAESVRNSLNTFVSTVITFTQNILP